MRLTRRISLALVMVGLILLLQVATAMDRCVDQSESCPLCWALHGTASLPTPLDLRVSCAAALAELPAVPAPASTSTTLTHAPRGPPLS